MVKETKKNKDESKSKLDIFTETSFLFSRTHNYSLHISSLLMLSVSEGVWTQSLVTLPTHTMT
jgi:hypothetical protein